MSSHDPQKFFRRMNKNGDMDAVQEDDLLSEDAEDIPSVTME